MSEEQKLPDSALPADKGQEYADQMIAKGNGETPTPETKEEKLLAGKFKSTDELEKAYAELQKKLGEQGNKKPEESADDKTKKPVDPTDPNLGIKKPEEKSEDEKKAQEVAEKAGLDWSELNTEFASSGQLADASYEKLEKAGIPRAMVDQFIDGQIAAAQLARAEVHNTVGGEKEYAAIVTWAAENLAPQEIEAFNNIARGRDLAATKMAVAGLKARYDASGASDPNLVLGDKGGGVVGYKSMTELTKDMKDPRYNSDPSFRAQVEAKVRVSNI
jgi:hypothetical protein